MTPLDRMACSSTPSKSHGLRRIPADARLEPGVQTWVYRPGDAADRRDAREYLRCECGKAYRRVVIVDTHRGTSPRRECSAICTGARGPACDCKCRGENHGGND